jgi:hypothetical protein
LASFRCVPVVARRRAASTRKADEKGYRVVYRPRRTPRGACLGGAKRKET